MSFPDNFKLFNKSFRNTPFAIFHYQEKKNLIEIFFSRFDCDNPESLSNSHGFNSTHAFDPWSLIYVREIAFSKIDSRNI